MKLRSGRATNISTEESPPRTLAYSPLETLLPELVSMVTTYLTISDIHSLTLTSRSLHFNFNALLYNYPIPNPNPVTKKASFEARHHSCITSGSSLKIRHIIRPPRLHKSNWYLYRSFPNLVTATYTTKFPLRSNAPFANLRALHIHFDNCVELERVLRRCVVLEELELLHGLDDLEAMIAVRQSGVGRTLKKLCKVYVPHVGLRQAWNHPRVARRGFEWAYVMTLGDTAAFPVFKYLGIRANGLNQPWDEGQMCGRFFLLWDIFTAQTLAATDRKHPVCWRFDPEDKGSREFIFKFQEIKHFTTDNLGKFLTWLTHHCPQWAINKFISMDRSQLSFCDSEVIPGVVKKLVEMQSRSPFPICISFSNSTLGSYLDSLLPAHNTDTGPNAYFTGSALCTFIHTLKLSQTAWPSVTNLGLVQASHSTWPALSRARNIYFRSSPREVEKLILANLPWDCYRIRWDSTYGWAKALERSLPCYIGLTKLILSTRLEEGRLLAGYFDPATLMRCVGYLIREHSLREVDVDLSAVWSDESGCFPPPVEVVGEDRVRDADEPLGRFDDGGGTWLGVNHSHLDNLTSTKLRRYRGSGLVEGVFAAEEEVGRGDYCSFEEEAGVLADVNRRMAWMMVPLHVPYLKKLTLRKVLVLSRKDRAWFYGFVGGKRGVDYLENLEEFTVIGLIWDVESGGGDAIEDLEDELTEEEMEPGDNPGQRYTSATHEALRVTRVKERIIRNLTLARKRTGVSLPLQVEIEHLKVGRTLHKGGVATSNGGLYSELFGV